MPHFWKITCWHSWRTDERWKESRTPRIYFNTMLLFQHLRRFPTDGMKIGMVNDGTVTVSGRWKIMLNGTATIIASVPASNGIVHIIRIQCCCRLQNSSSLLRGFIEHTSGAEATPEVFKPKNEKSFKYGIEDTGCVCFRCPCRIAVFFYPPGVLISSARNNPEGLTMNIWINGLSGNVML